MAVNAEKLFVEVVLQWPSLRVELLLGHCEGIVVCLVLCVVDVPVLMSGAFLLGLVVLRGVVDADVEDRVTSERRERKLLDEGFSEGLHRALGLKAWIPL